MQDAIERRGARFVGRKPDDEESLRRAGVLEADAIVMLTHDDYVTLHVALKARDLNPGIRIVLRQFNRTLGRKIEQNLENCSAISLSSHVAATYAGVALDHECFYGLQFPDIDGQLVGFSKRNPERIGHGERLIAMDGDKAVVFGRIRPNARQKPPSLPNPLVEWFRPRDALVWLRRQFQRIDPLLRGVIAGAVTIFVVATVYYAYALRLDPVTALYFVTTTMTTTGFGDVSARAAPGPGLVATIFLMICGVLLTGILYAVLTARFTKAQWNVQQGLRQVRRRGHIIVCGAGNVGSRVIEYLVAQQSQVVVVELNPNAEIVEQSRDRYFDLLTGDATHDATLDLCNLTHAKSLVALTHSDTNNLEVALGARARNPALPVVMRCEEGAFAESIARHFGMDRTFGMAGLFAPAVAGLAQFRGARGRVVFAGRDFAIGEQTHGASVVPPPLGDAIPLCVLRAGEIRLIEDFAGVEPGDRVLMLLPRWPTSARPPEPL